MLFKCKGKFAQYSFKHDGERIKNWIVPSFLIKALNKYTSLPREDEDIKVSNNAQHCVDGRGSKRVCRNLGNADGAHNTKSLVKAKQSVQEISITNGIQ